MFRNLVAKTLGAFPHVALQGLGHGGRHARRTLQGLRRQPKAGNATVDGHFRAAHVVPIGIRGRIYGQKV